MRLAKNKKILSTTSVVIIFVIVVIMMSFTINSLNINKLTKVLEKITIEYYDNEFTKYMPKFLKRNGTLKITLSYLKQMNNDVSVFEENECDLENTYVILTYNEKTNYDIESHLTCK